MNLRRLSHVLLSGCCIYVLLLVVHALLMLRADLIVSRMP